MLIVVLIFLILVLVAYAAWRLLPEPVGLIVAAIVAICAVIYLVSNVGELDADAAVLAAKSWGLA